MSFRFGIAVRDITPPLGLPMGGYAARVGVAEGTLDPLYCRALVAADDVSAIALVALDLVYVSSVWATPVRAHVAARLGVSPTHVLIAATHTHAGPAVFRSGGVDADGVRAFEEWLAEEVVRTVDRARAGLRPARLAAGQVRVAGVGASRREVTDTIDDAVRVLVANAPNGECLGVIAAYGCHPTVLPPANRRYSRDLFGAAVDAAAERVAAPLVLFNGAAADVSTRFTRRVQDESEVHRLGEILGASIASAVSSGVAIEVGPVSGSVEALPVDIRPVPSVETAQHVVSDAATRLQEARAAGLEAGALRAVAAQFEGALAQLYVATRGGWEGLLGRVAAAAELQVLEIGGTRLVAAPGELFSAVGKVICDTRPPAMLIGYANDYLGYFVPTGEAAAGGYESLIAMVAPGSAEQVGRRLMEMVGQAESV